jgi:3',5'-cyclic AMP phosphodiesterase CpdA
MRILHISDLHIGNEGDVDRWKRAEKIVRRIIRAWGDDGDRPLVLITGDIVDDGTEVEYIEARRILRPLHRAGFQVAPLPGNHDYGWNGAHAQEKRFKLFKKYLFGIETRVTYPDVPYADDDVSVITLNSMHAETGFWDGLLADGELGSRQRDELDELITSLREERKKTHRIVVALHHHPFQFPDASVLKKAKERIGHRLKDGVQLMKLLSGRIDVLLFGHEHRHVDFSQPFEGHLFTEEYAIPCILSSGRSTDSDLPARVIIFEGRRKPRVESAPWSNPKKFVG